MRALVPLIPKQIELTCAENLNELLEQPKRGTPFRVLIFDSNVFEDGHNSLKELDQLAGHRLLKEGKRILLHPRQQTSHQQELKEKGFVGFYTKPFLIEEIAKIIEDNL